MSRIRSTNTKLEKDFFRILIPFWRDGYKHRKHYPKLIGKSDVVFLDQKIAIFVDGDFWHGYQFKKLSQRLPKKYWLAKIEKNKKRDRGGKSGIKKGWMARA